MPVILSNTKDLDSRKLIVIVIALAMLHFVQHDNRKFPLQLRDAYSPRPIAMGLTFLT